MAVRFNILVVLLVFLVPLSGCLQSTLGCGEGYSEMHNADYVEYLISVDANGKLSAEFESGDSPGFLEESEAYQTSADVYATLHVMFDDGSESQIAFRQDGWDNTGDGAGGS